MRVSGRLFDQAHVVGRTKTEVDNAISSATADEIIIEGDDDLLKYAPALDQVDRQENYTLTFVRSEFGK